MSNYIESNVENPTQIETPPKPKFIAPVIEGIPQLLKDYRHWIVWQAEYRPKGAKPWTKVLYDAVTERHGKSNKKYAWRHITTVWDRYVRKADKWDGIGFVLDRTAIPIVGIDLDHCRDIETGELAPWAVAVVNRFTTYTEISPSGNGLRLFCRGRLPKDGRKHGDYEIYDKGRFLTVTGHHLDGTPPTIEDRQDEITAWVAETFPPEPPKAGKPSIESPSTPSEPGERATPKPVDAADEEIVAMLRSDEEAARLWDGYFKDHSADDLALCNRLRFFCGPDPERIDQLFRASGLIRGKWDEPHYSGGETYGHHTIATALNGEVFDWDSHRAKIESTKVRVNAEERACQICENGGDAWNGPDPALAALAAGYVVDPGLEQEYAERQPPVEKPKTRRAAVKDMDLEGLPDPEPLVDGFIDVESLTNIYGPTNVGKSFVGLDLANSIARGVPFLNHFRVYTALPTAYIYAEGRRGLKKRVKAWRMERNHGPTENLVFFPCRFTLNDAEGREATELLDSATAALGQKPKVLVVDTLAKNMEGDENGAKDMSALVNRLSDLVTTEGMTVVVVHHTGKDESKGARGSSTLKGGIDTEFEVLGRDERSIQISSPKVRDNAKNSVVVASRKIVNVGEDKFGNPLTTLVFTFDRMVDQTAAKEAKAGDKAMAMGDMEALVLSALTDEETTAAALAKEVGTTGRAIRRILSALRDKQQIGYRQVKEESGVKGFRYRTLHKKP